MTQRRLRARRRRRCTWRTDCRGRSRSASPSEAPRKGTSVALTDGDGTPAGRDRGRRDLRLRQGARGGELLPHDRGRRTPGSPASTRSTRATSPARSPSSTGPSRRSRSSRMDPADTRTEFEERGWKRVVGFQTRNPIHRAHEYLTKVALETVDGLLIHPLVGETKSDDVPAATRVACYSVLVDKYYPDDRVARVGVPGRDALRGAARGDLARDLPQELRLLALHRRPRPCGRRRLLRHVRRAAHLRRVRAARARDRAAVLRARVLVQGCGSMATPKTCPHGGDDHVFLSGTKVRELLQAGELPPVEFSRPEVAEVLIDAYR